MYKVFLSSTTADLGEARRAVAAALPAGGFAIHMERFVADPRSEAARDAGEVREADVAVFLLGWRYGSRPTAGGPSYTHLELRAAVEAKIPCLVFLQAETEERRAASDAPDDMLKLREEAGKAAAPQLWDDPEKLPGKVADALRQHLNRPLTRAWLRARLEEGCQRLGGGSAWPELDARRTSLLSRAPPSTLVLLDGPQRAGAAMASLARDLHEDGGVAILVPGSALDAHQPWSSLTQQLRLQGWTPERTRPALVAAGDGRVLVMIPGLEGSRDPEVWRTSLPELQRQLGEIGLIVSVDLERASRVLPGSLVPADAPERMDTAGSAPAPLPWLPWLWPWDVRDWLELQIRAVEQVERDAARPWRPDERVPPNPGEDDPVYVPLGGEEREAVRRVEYRRAPIRPAAVILQGSERVVGGVPGGWVAGRTEVPDVCRELLRRKEPIVLLGEPGSGKTTTLRQMFLRFARRARWLPGAPVPVFVRLGSFRQVVRGTGAQEVIGLIREAIGQGVRSLRQHLQGGQVTTPLVVFFDGMDEIPHSAGHSERVAALARFAAEYAPQVRCVFACRTNDFDPLFRHAQLVLKPFDEPRMREYLGRRLGERFRVDGQEQDPPRAARRLLAPDQLAEAARNPFNLALACDLLQLGQWPRGVAALLMGHVERRAERAWMRAGTEEPTREEIAASVKDWAALAWAMFRRDGAVVMERAEAEAEVGAGPVRSAIDGGLLVPEERRLRFQHHRLQEVLVAWSLCQPGAPQPAWGQVLGSPRWQETLLGYFELGGRGAEALEVVVGGVREAAGRFRELDPRVERAELEVSRADEEVASIGPDGLMFRRQGPPYPIYSDAQAERRAQAQALAASARERLARLRTLPRDEELTGSEAALFAARVSARLPDALALREELAAVVDGLMRYGRPPAQVRALWAWREAGLASSLLAPARRSEVAWVRSQALMVIAATPAQRLDDQDFVEEVEAQLLELRLLPVAGDLLEAVADKPERWRLVRAARRVARVGVGLEVGIWVGTGVAVLGLAAPTLLWHEALAAYLLGSAGCWVLLAQSHDLSATRRLVIGAAVVGGALLTWLVPVGAGGEITPASLEVLPEALVGGAPAWVAWVALAMTRAVGRRVLRGRSGDRPDLWGAQLRTLCVLGVVGSVVSLFRWQPLGVFGALLMGLAVGELALLGMVLWVLMDLIAEPWRGRWREAEGQRWAQRLISATIFSLWDYLRWALGVGGLLAAFFPCVGLLGYLGDRSSSFGDVVWALLPAWVSRGASAIGAGIGGVVGMVGAALLGLGMILTARSLVGMTLTFVSEALSRSLRHARWLARSLHLTWSHLLRRLRRRPHPPTWQAWSRTFLHAAPPDRLDLLATLDPASLHLTPSDLLSRLPDLEDHLGDHPGVISAWHATMYRLQESARQQRWAPPPGDEPPPQGTE